MRITWLNDERTEAVVELGRLWWRRQAEVRLDGHWWYGPDFRTPIPDKMAKQLNLQRPWTTIGRVRRRRLTSSVQP